MTPRTTVAGLRRVIALTAATLLTACAGASSKPRPAEAPPPVAEEVLRDAASRIARLPGVDRNDHNPAHFARVANHLWALGEGPCLEALERVGDERPDAVIALVCVLFDATPDGEPRPTRTGPLEHASQAERFLREHHADFPVVWVAGLPIWAEELTWFVPNFQEEFTGFVQDELSGRGQGKQKTGASPFLSWARQDAVFATSPPRLPDDPAAAVSAHFENDEHLVAWRKLGLFRSGVDYLLSVARHQGFAALEGLLDDEVAAALGYLPQYNHRLGDRFWSGVEAITAAGGVRWDREAGRYARRDE